MSLPNESNLALLLRRARETSCISQEELARRCGVSTTTIYNYEHARSVPRASVLPLLCSVLLLSEQQMKEQIHAILCERWRHT